MAKVEFLLCLIKVFRFDDMNEDIKKIANYIDSFCHPVYGRDDKDQYELFGSCVSVSVGGNKRICTATHLAKKLDKSGKVAVIGVSSGFETLDLASMKPLDIEGVDADICLIEFSNTNDKIQYISHRNFYQTDRFFGKSFQYLQGYPLTKNTFKDIHKNGVIAVGRIGVGMKIDQTLNYPRNDINTDYHYLFKYNGGLYEKTEKEPQGVNFQSVPELKGFSGCGVWNVYNPKDLPSIKLAGIFIELEHRIGVATKIRKLLDIR